MAVYDAFVSYSHAKAIAGGAAIGDPDTRTHTARFRPASAIAMDTCAVQVLLTAGPNPSLHRLCAMATCTCLMATPD